MSVTAWLDFDFGKSWDWVSYILRDGRSMDMSSFIYEHDSCYGINMFSGKRVYLHDLQSGILYQEANEVADISQFILRMDEIEIQRRFEQASRLKAYVYRGGWSEEDYPLFLEYFREVRSFYQSAASQGFGVINAIS